MDKDEIAQLLKPHREKIDRLDDQIIDLLAERLEVIRDVSVIKQENHIEPVLQERVDEVRDRCVERGITKGYDPNFMHSLYTLIINYSCDVEQKYQDDHIK
ncbi:MAG: chorismate mutase [Pseudomonadota bacterium]